MMFVISPDTFFSLKRLINRVPLRQLEDERDLGHSMFIFNPKKVALQFVVENTTRDERK